MIAFQVVVHGANCRRRIVRCCSRAESDASQISPPKTILSVCGGPTCSKEKYGKQIFVTLSEILRSYENISVEKVGCLGECGNGPNVGIFQQGTSPAIETGLSESSSIVGFAERIANCKLDEKLYAGLVNKDLGNEQLSSGDIAAALSSYTLAVNLLQDFSPQLTSLVLCNRSTLFLEMGDAERSLADANAAIDLDVGLAVAWKRKANAHEALNQKECAIDALEMWGRLEPTKNTRQQVDNRIKALKRRRWF